MSDDGTVRIHNKIYKTVSLRVTEFREKHPDYGIETEVQSAAELVMVKATITDASGRVLSTGYAEEVRGSTNINKTSAVENAETSAVGRALAFFGLAGTEIASADEVQNAITQQGQKEAEEKAAKCAQAVRENWEIVEAIQVGIADPENMGSAAEAWFTLPDEDKRALWVAPSKGGIFTTKEREVIQSPEFRQSYYGVSNDG